MKTLIIEHIKQFVCEHKSKNAIMIIHPSSLDVFIEQIEDPGLYMAIANKIMANETTVQMFGLNIKLYRSLDIPKNEIIIYENTN